MGRWMVEMFTARRGDIAIVDDGCPVCDHPFGHMAHVCIGPVSPMRVDRSSLETETVVA